MLKNIIKMFGVTRITPCDLKIKAKNRELLTTKYNNHIDNCNICQHNILEWHNNHIKNCRICLNKR